jgi:hypothetical protein
MEINGAPISILCTTQGTNKQACVEATQALINWIDARMMSSDKAATRGADRHALDRACRHLISIVDGVPL